MSKRALLSVTDKSQICEFARGLVGLGYEIVSTGGTAHALREAGVSVIDVSAITGFPEMLDGRVKTLHPMVHGGILGDIRLPSHAAAMEQAGIEPFSIVAVNLYAFESTVQRNPSLDEAIESIDIGGPAMVRAAAKNHANVAVVVDPNDYESVLLAEELGNLGELRGKLAAKAFRHTAYYDSMIARYLTGVYEPDEFLPEQLTVGMRWDGVKLRYGENAHQAAKRYVDPLAPMGRLSQVEAEGKEISYNNWLDAEAAWELVSDLPNGSCAIIKHGNPCGAAFGADLGESYRLARSSDPISAFGGIVAFHGELDDSAVSAMTEKGNFLEVVIATKMDSKQIEKFKQGAPWTTNVRFLEGQVAPRQGFLNVRSLRGAYLVQQNDEDPGEEAWKVVTALQPTEDQWKALRLAWAIVPHVKSNAIVISNSNQLLGVGAGQMNRVQSVRLALEQAGAASNGAALASDAFFPFPDSIEVASAAGISCIIQPGGSKKDADVIAAANEKGIAMVFTNTRHFRH